MDQQQILEATIKYCLWARDRENFQQQGNMKQKTDVALSKEFNKKEAKPGYLPAGYQAQAAS